MGLELAEDVDDVERKALVRAQLVSMEAQTTLFNEQARAARAQTAAFVAQEELARKQIARMESDAGKIDSLHQDVSGLLSKLIEVTDYVSIITHIKSVVETRSWTADDPSVPEGHTMIMDPEVEMRLKALKKAELEAGEAKMEQLASRIRRTTQKEEAEEQARIKRKVEEEARRAPRDRRFGRTQGQRGPSPVDTTSSTQAVPQNPQTPQGSA